MWLLRALRVAAFLTPLVSTHTGYWICRICAALAYVTKAHARRQVLSNLHQIDTRTSWFWRERQAYRVFNTVVTNYYDLLRLRTVDRQSVIDLIDVQGQEHLDTALARGRGVIILSAHVGNYGVVARYPAITGLKTALIAEQIEPPELFQFMVRLRSVMDITIIPAGRNALGPILRVLRNNGVLFIAGDRAVAGEGQAVPFFGRSASLPIGPVLLARLTGATLLPACTYRTRDQRSVVVIEPPLVLSRTEDRDADLLRNMTLVAQTLQRMISFDPGQWAVLQSIWEDHSETAPSRRQGTRTFVPLGSQRKPQLADAQPVDVSIPSLASDQMSEALTRR